MVALRRRAAGPGGRRAGARAGPGVGGGRERRPPPAAASGHADVPARQRAAGARRPHPLPPLARAGVVLADAGGPAPPYQPARHGAGGRAARGLCGAGPRRAARPRGHRSLGAVALPSAARALLVRLRALGLAPRAAARADPCDQPRQRTRARRRPARLQHWRAQREALQHISLYYSTIGGAFAAIGRKSRRHVCAPCEHGAGNSLLTALCQSPLLARH